MPPAGASACLPIGQQFVVLCSLEQTAHCRQTGFAVIDRVLAVSLKLLLLVGSACGRSGADRSGSERIGLDWTGLDHRMSFDIDSHHLSQGSDKALSICFL